MQNRAKIDPKWYPGGAWGDPRGLPGASRGTVRARFRTKLKIVEEKSDSGRLPGRPGRPPGTQRNPKNRPKIDFLLKKGVPNVYFCRFLRARPFFRHFARIFIDFSRKIDEKSMKKTMRFFTASLVFLNMATLTKHRVLRYESYFSIFRVFAFFLKKPRKNSSKIQATFFPSKNTKKSSRGTRFGSQNGPELTSEGPKISKTVQKRPFWTIFEIFGSSDVNSGPFWDPKRVPRDHFLTFFDGNNVGRILEQSFRCFF